MTPSDAQPRGAAHAESRDPIETTQPLADRDHPGRRLGWKGEVALALLPTATILAVLAFVEALTRQHVLFASLAGSAFLIYLDPEHPTNRVRTLVAAHLGAAALGFGANAVLGASYLASAVALVATILYLITFDVVHPPAVATALSFAFRGELDSALSVFVLSLGITAGLVVIQLVSFRLLRRFLQRGQAPTASGPPPNAPTGRA